MSESTSEKPLVSVVVPVYNVEAYLDRCVESLVNQTLENIEIVLVDDGSTDGSPALCDAWAEKDARIRVVHKENGGLSDARNVGVDFARAEWVGFVDSDDHVSPEMYEVLYHNLQETHADMSICGIYDVYANRIEEPNRADYEVLTSEEAIKLCLHGKDISVTAVNRLYPASVFDYVRFPKGKTTEDGFTAIDFLSHANKIVVDYRPQYYYEHRVGTLSTHPYDIRSCDVIDAYEHNLEIVKQKYPSALEVALFRCYWARFTVLDSMLIEGAQRDDARRHEIIDYLRSHYTDIMRNPYVGQGRKIAMKALMVSWHLYGALSKAQRKRIANQ